MNSFISLVSDPYFFWSFLPLSFLGVSFWLLFFERNTQKKDSLWIFLLAIFGGGFAAMCAFYLLEKDALSPLLFWKVIFVEEILKIFAAIIVMEVFRQRFQTIAGGILFGFSVGLGFSLVENILYLKNFHENFGFTESFWLGFQGRFWSSMLIHGVTTGFFGIFYAGAYLSKTLVKAENESPLSVILAPFSWRNLMGIFSFRCTKWHLLFHQKVCLSSVTSRAILFEGFLFCVLLHAIFNGLMIAGFIFGAIFLSLFGMIFLRSVVERLR